MLSKHCFPYLPSIPLPTIFITHYPNIMVQLQLQAKKTDRVKAVEASIKVLLDNPTKETAALIKEAQAEHEGMYPDSYSSAVASRSILDQLLESFSNIGLQF